jgi:multidrug transporter EmrE-like cation transporter
MAWVFLLLAIALEILATVEMKLSDGFTKIYPSVLAVISFAFSIFLASAAFKKLDIGLAYAIWSGLGTVGISIVGIFFFDEPSNLLKAACLTLIIIGVVGLNYFA